MLPEGKNPVSATEQIKTKNSEAIEDLHPRRNQPLARRSAGKLQTGNCASGFAGCARRSYAARWQNVKQAGDTRSDRQKCQDRQPSDRSYLAESCRMLKSQHEEIGQSFSFQPRLFPRTATRGFPSGTKNPPSKPPVAWKHNAMRHSLYLLSSRTDSRRRTGRFWEALEIPPAMIFFKNYAKCRNR